MKLRKKDGKYICAGCGKVIEESISVVIPICERCSKRKKIDNLLKWKK